MTNYTREEAIAKGELAQIVFWTGDVDTTKLTGAHNGR